jgi:hypothetical protein
MVASMFDKNSNRAALPPGMARILPKEDTLHIEPNDDKPDPEELKYVPQKLHHKWIAFSKHQTRITRPNGVYDHAIDTEEGKKIPNLPIYNLSGRELEILREYLETAQEKGWIRPSKSPVGAPILSSCQSQTAQ